MKKKCSTKRKTANSVKGAVSGQLPKNLTEMFDYFGIVATQLDSMEANESGTVRYNYKIVSDNGNLIKLMLDKFFGNFR